MNIIVIGHFGWKNTTISGAIAKTRQIFNELKNQYPDKKIGTLDIYNWRKKPISIAISLIASFFKYKKIVFVGSSTNGPLICFISSLKKLFGSDFYYCVVGAEIANTLIQNRNRISHLSFVNTFFVETDDCREAMVNLGLVNTEILVNFKDIDPIISSEIRHEWNEPYQFCTFSRVIKEKGITDAINAIHAINKMKHKQYCRLDVYGPIDENYKQEFVELVEKHPEIQYCGIINNNESVDTLKNYYCLLFPTLYQTEGIPGTILDAFAAGVPTICSDWNRCRYVVDHLYNGICYKFGSVEDLQKAILWAIDNEEKVSEMRLNCLHTFAKYIPNEAIQPLIRKINMM